MEAHLDGIAWTRQPMEARPSGHPAAPSTHSPAPYIALSPICGAIADIVRRPGLHHDVAGARRGEHVARLPGQPPPADTCHPLSLNRPEGGARMSAHPSARNGKKMTRRACALAAAGVAWLMGLTGAAPQAWAAVTSDVTSRAGRSGAGGILTQLAPSLGVLAAAAIAVLSGGLIVSRRRPRGTLVVWLGSRWRCLAPVEVHEPLELTDLFPAACPDGWAICWYRRAPLVGGPAGPAMRLVAGQVTTIEAAPPVTFTWLPGGFDPTAEGEPPGSPFLIAVDPIATGDRA